MTHNPTARARFTGRFTESTTSCSQALIAKKANLNVRNEFGSTPIAQAAELADARMVKMLLDAGAEPEGANPDGQTALMLAIKTGEMASSKR